MIGLFFSPSAHAAATIPMYRLYNPSNYEHLYTSNVAEKDHLVATGWGRYEGIGWNAPASGEKVYRLYNSILRDHHYTKDWNEVSELTRKYHWTYEGLAWYSDVNRTQPVYRLFNPNLRSGSHHYTLAQNEVKTLQSRGWRYEGVAWYAASAGAPQQPEDNVILNVPLINQGNTMLCEGASLLQAMHYKGKATNQSLMSFVNSMPIASDKNPYHGYSGEWRHNVNGTYQGMMADPVVTWAQRNGGNAANITGSGVNGIKQEIRNGNPVVAWITYNYESPQFKQMPWGRAVWNGHVVTVDGFRNGAYHIADPVFGGNWINSGTFERAFNINGMAVAVR